MQALLVDLAAWFIIGRVDYCGGLSSVQGLMDAPFDHLIEGPLDGQHAELTVGGNREMARLEAIERDDDFERFASHYVRFSGQAGAVPFHVDQIEVALHQVAVGREDLRVRHDFADGKHAGLTGTE